MSLLASDFSDANKNQNRIKRPEVVRNLGSSGALNALSANAIDIAIIARPLNADEEKRGFRASEYAQTAFVVVSSRPLTQNLEKSDLVEIFSARRKVWPDGTAIRLVLRPKADTDSKQLESFSPAMHDAMAEAWQREGLTVAITDQDAASRIEKTRGAIGTSTLSLLLSEQRSLYAIPIAGVTPNFRNIANGTYPMIRHFYLVTRQDTSSDTKRFADFILSARGARILMRNGQVPVSQPSNQRRNDGN